jgi:hypothetical protein
MTSRALPRARARTYTPETGTLVVEPNPVGQKVGVGHSARVPGHPRAGTRAMSDRSEA